MASSFRFHAFCHSRLPRRARLRLFTFFTSLCAMPLNAYRRQRATRQGRRADALRFTAARYQRQPSTTALAFLRFRVLSDTKPRAIY